MVSLSWREGTGCPSLPRGKDTFAPFSHQDGSPPRGRRERRSSGLLYSFKERPRNSLQQHIIPGFNEDADERFRSGRPDQHPAHIPRSEEASQMASALRAAEKGVLVTDLKILKRLGVPFETIDQGARILAKPGAGGKKKETGARPSPVEKKSPAIIWPDCSPPRFDPMTSSRQVRTCPPRDSALALYLPGELLLEALLLITVATTPLPSFPSERAILPGPRE